MQAASDYAKAMALLETGDFAAALTALRGVMEDLPGNEQVGRALVRLGRGAAQAAMLRPVESEEARALYDCALAAYLAIGGTISDPADCGLLRAVCFNLGCYYDGRGLYAEAIRHYRDAWTLGPQHADTPNNLSRILIKAGQPREALALLKEAMQYHPNSATLLERKQQALLAAGGTTP